MGQPARHRRRVHGRSRGTPLRASARAAASGTRQVTLTFAGGTLAGPFTAEGGGTLHWAGGTIGGWSADEAELGAGCPLVIDGDAAKELAGHMITRGPVTWAGGELAVTGDLVSDGTFTVQASGQLTGGGTLRNRGMLSPAREVTLAVRGLELVSSGAIDLSPRPLSARQLICFAVPLRIRHGQPLPTVNAKQYPD